MQVHPHEGFLRTSRWNTSVISWEFHVTRRLLKIHRLDVTLSGSLDLMAEGHTTSSQMSQNMPVGSGVKSYQFVIHPNIYQPCFCLRLGPVIENDKWSVFFGRKMCVFRLDIFLRFSVSLLFCFSLLVCFLCFSAFLLLGVSLSFCSSNPNKLWKQ
jgi:hypothetical protein